MKIAIIGTGRMGQALGRLWAEKGHAVMFGSRETARGVATAKTVGSGATGGSVQDAARFCEVAVLAIPWYAFTDFERSLDGTLDGKILIDCINPLRSTGSLALGHKWSAGEEIQKTLHRVHVVKAFNHIYWQQLDEPTFGGQAPSLFYCSNFDDAKAAVVQLGEEIGFEPIDAGPIKNARLTEPLAALWMQLAFTCHQGVDVAFKLIRRDE